MIDGDSYRVRSDTSRDDSRNTCCRRENMKKWKALADPEAFERRFTPVAERVAGISVLAPRPARAPAR